MNLSRARAIEMLLKIAILASGAQGRNQESTCREDA